MSEMDWAKATCRSPNRQKTALSRLKECRGFESVYTEMEEKGLIQALRLRTERLFGSLNVFHQSAKSISRETSDITD
jgi:hypothetical protein